MDHGEVGGDILEAESALGGVVQRLALVSVIVEKIGVLLGSRENFLRELTSLGFQSILFFLIPSVFSVVAVYPLTKLFLDKKRDKKKEEE